MVQVACGSRDAQTLCLTDDGKVYSWGDGDFGKLGRGGSEGCSLPKPIERLNGQDVIKIGEIFVMHRGFKPSLARMNLVSVLSPSKQ